MIRKTIYFLVLLAFVGSAIADGIKVPFAPQTVKLGRKGMKRQTAMKRQYWNLYQVYLAREIPTIVELDLKGDGKKEKFKIKTYFEENTTGSQYVRVTVYRVKTDGKWKKVWSYRKPQAYDVTWDICPLDDRNPRQSFLIFNFATGPSGGTLRVFKWGENTFNEVGTGRIAWGKPVKMRDGRNAIIENGEYLGKEVKNIYTYKNGFILPANYHYPEHYQEEIEKTLKDFNRLDQYQEYKFKNACKGLILFLYGGRTEEGVRLYNRMWKLELHNKKDYDHRGFVNLTALFRAYAYFERGKKGAGLDVLHRYISETVRFNILLGNYYYIKNDFKNALKYYRRGNSDRDEQLAAVKRDRKSSPDAKKKWEIETKMREQYPNYCDIQIKFLEEVLKTEEN